MRYRLVLFDFDGTLMDTSEGILHCARVTLEKNGIEIPCDTNWRTFIGPPLDDCFRLTFGITDEKILAKLCKDYDDYYVSNGYAKACFYPHVPEVLQTLKDEGYILAIASMKYTSLLDAMTKHFDIRKYFDGMEGQCLGRLNTKADIIASLCDRFCVSREQCIMIGDSGYDAQGALEAGCSMIKVNWGFGFDEDEPGCATSMDEVLSIIRKGNTR